MKDRLAVVVVSLCGLALMAAYLWTLQDWWREGENDFPAFYAGAQLLGSDNLYDVEALHEAETRFLGTYAKTHGYVRPPFHAALMWPLTKLSYPLAYFVYAGVLFACYVYFAVRWPLPGFWGQASFCAMAAPVFTALAIGQDLPILLAMLAGAASLHRSGRPFAAGLLFSLGAMKPHLFLLAPIWVFARRDWPFLKGTLAGGGVLTTVSFALAGWDWPLRMLETAANPAFSPNPHLMPNLTGLLLDVPAAEAWYALAAVTLAASCWYASRDEPFETGLATVLLGGVLLGRHSYLADCALWLPACLTLLCVSRTQAMRLGAVVLMLPFIYLLGPATRPTAVAAVAALLLAIGTAVERRLLGPRTEATPQSNLARA